MTGELATGPEPSLSGIVVLERADRLAVSVCGSLLAELGATVLQVGPDVSDPDLNEVALAKARRVSRLGKIPVALDLAQPGGQSGWRALVARADIVLLAPDGAQDAELVATECRNRIVCALSSFGLDAPAGTPRLAETGLQAVGGMMGTTGAPGGPPERANVPLVEMFTALNAATTILAALRTGDRAMLDIAGFDSALALLTTYLANVAQGRGRGYRIGCRHHLCSPWNAYRTADGWIQLCSTTDEQWRTILHLTGRPDLDGDPRFANNARRVENSAAVDQVIEDWAVRLSADQAVRSLLAAGLPVGAVRTLPDLLADPDLAARGMVANSGGSDLRPGSFLGSTAVTNRPAMEPALVLASLEPARPHADEAKPAGTKPLSGIRVIEIGPYTAGPLAGRYLADLGAEVIKVEPGGGEVSRAWTPQFAGYSGYFANCNVGKASVVLDLKSGPDRERFFDLVRTADVLLENLRPGALDKLGLGPHNLRELAPRLVYCSVSGFGRDGGPRPALDSVVQAEAGLMWLVGEGGRPQRVGTSMADQGAALAAPLRILAALRSRDISGQGCEVDVSMQDVLAWAIGLAWPDGAPALAPWAEIAVQDGWIVARQGGDAVGPVLGEPGALSRDEAVSRLRRAGIEAVGVLELDEVFAHEAVLRRGLVQYADPDGARVPVLSSPHRVGGPLPVGDLPGAPGSDGERIFRPASA